MHIRPKLTIFEQKKKNGVYFSKIVFKFFLAHVYENFKGMEFYGLVKVFRLFPPFKNSLIQFVKMIYFTYYYIIYAMVFRC